MAYTTAIKIRIHKPSSMGNPGGGGGGTGGGGNCTYIFSSFYCMCSK